jgi:hypothetical protein
MSSSTARTSAPDTYTLNAAYLSFEEQANAFDCAKHVGEKQIRMVAEFAKAPKDSLVAEACNHPNCLVLPFRLELIRLAA